VEEQRKSLGLERSVELIGFRTDVARIMAAADCLVMSSDDEGVPVVALEAMAAGRPVVSTEVGSIAAAVLHGRTGFLVPKGDVAALADALVSVLGAPDRRRDLGEAGRARVCERFPVQRCVEETERLLLGLRR
jgi:glycosyltransferase involved in cell wall biosynthesis